MTARRAQPRTPVSSILALPVAARFSRLGPRVAGVNTIAAAVAGIIYCASPNYAQAQAAAAPASETSALDEIVVTASAQGVRKLDASYNIVSTFVSMLKGSRIRSEGRLEVRPRRLQLNPTVCEQEQRRLLRLGDVRSPGIPVGICPGAGE